MPPCPYVLVNKHQRIPKGQSKMDNPEKLATQDTCFDRRDSRGSIQSSIILQSDQFISNMIILWYSSTWIILLSPVLMIFDRYLCYTSLFVSEINIHRNKQQTTRGRNRCFITMETNIFSGKNILRMLSKKIIKRRKSLMIRPWKFS